MPTKEELRQILNYASEEARVSIALMASSGLRIESLGNKSGTYGLRFLSEMRIAYGRDEFLKIPTMVVVTMSLSKAERKYFPFERGVRLS